MSEAQPRPDGCLVTIEGGEGAGKSTLHAALAERARTTGATVVTCREPGGTSLGERVRKALLGAADAPEARAELLLFAAARAQLVEEVIRPALDAGALVICDRYSDSSVAYQCHGRHVVRAVVDAANDVATGGLTPALTLLLDLPPATGLRRGRGGSDYIERESLEFHERVRTGYLELARQEPERWLVLDATLPANTLADTAWTKVKKLLDA